MAGILLITHNGLGDSLVDCVGHVFGSAPTSLMVLAVQADDDVEAKVKRGQDIIRHLDDGSGVLVLTDVFGATPANIAMRLCQLPNVAGVAGVNLPMLLRVVSNAGKPLPGLVQMAQDGGRDCIVPIDEEHGDRCNVAK